MQAKERMAKQGAHVLRTGDLVAENISQHLIHDIRKE